MTDVKSLSRASMMQRWRVGEGGGGSLWEAMGSRKAEESRDKDAADVLNRFWGSSGMMQHARALPLSSSSSAAAAESHQSESAAAADHVTIAFVMQVMNQPPFLAPLTHPPLLL